MGPMNQDARSKPFQVSFYRDDLKGDVNGTSLNKQNRNGNWYIVERKSIAFSRLADNLEMVYFIPGWDGKSRLNELYDVSHVPELSDEQRQVYDFVIKNPITQVSVFDYGPHEASHFRAYFSKKNDWLPNRLDLKFENALPIIYEFLVWRLYDQQLIPWQVQLRDSEDEGVYYDLKFETIERCSEADVKERCTMAFYELPELGMPEIERANSRWWLWLILVVVFGLVGWVFWKKWKAA